MVRGIGVSTRWSRIRPTGRCSTLSWAGGARISTSRMALQRTGLDSNQRASRRRRTKRTGDFSDVIAAIDALHSDTTRPQSVARAARAGLRRGSVPALACRQYRHCQLGCLRRHVSQLLPVRRPSAWRTPSLDSLGPQHGVRRRARWRSRVSRRGVGAWTALRGLPAAAHPAPTSCRRLRVAADLDGEGRLDEGRRTSFIATSKPNGR